MYIHTGSLLVWMDTHTNRHRGSNTGCTQTDLDKFSAVDCGMQPAQYDEMDMADQPQQKLNNIVRRPFLISQSLSLFSYMTVSHPAPLPLIPPSSSILLPPLFISALCFHSTTLQLSYPTTPKPTPSIHHSTQPSTLPSSFQPKIHTQTVEQSDGQDQTYVLNYNPS